MNCGLVSFYFLFHVQAEIRLALKHTPPLYTHTQSRLQSAATLLRGAGERLAPARIAPHVRGVGTARLRVPTHRQNPNQEAFRSVSSAMRCVLRQEVSQALVGAP
jgi:hypothetical protein